jgi:uncharacterized protein YyaL (SSP411 family)
LAEARANLLKDSSSPYLRSAAHQPVDWHEWGADAFARAQAEDKPILLDIGAVWCHWCHVIDRESYENPEIAALINRFFIPVKVDRDERPDVDARYQTAISAISGQGGWPLTAFLTSDGRPFFGGTYFPPDDAMGRPGFRRILVTVAEAYQNRRGEILEAARALTEAVAKAEAFTAAGGRVDPGLVEQFIDSAVRLFDLRHGGFGQAPKFPHPTAIDLLLECYQATGRAHLLTVAESTLEKMARGGIYDQLAGGFHRYSTDARWVVPHFEKMSYDNSELLKNYLHGYQVTGKPLFREVAEGIIGWVDQELSDRERGGFYASQDADYSLEDDGDYFTWTREELRAALDGAEARLAELYYDVGEVGEMHHNPAKNVLWVAGEPAEIARELGLSEPEFAERLARARAKMLAARQGGRPKPRVDTTVYAGWSALMASAYLEAARVLGRPDCRAFALKTLDRVLAEAWDEKQGFAHRLGSPRLPGLLDDQIFTAAALLDAYETTLDRRYFEAAERAARIVLRDYAAPDGGFFDRAAGAIRVGEFDLRRKPFQDSPVPGANSIAAIVLDRLYEFTGEASYREAAEKTLAAFSGMAAQYGLFASTYALAVLLHARRGFEVIVTGAAGDLEALRLEQAAHRVYRFGKAVLRVTPGRPPADGLAPAFREILAGIDPGRVQALVCVEAACQPPVTDPDELAALLGKLAPGPLGR